MYGIYFLANMKLQLNLYIGKKNYKFGNIQNIITVFVKTVSNNRAAAASLNKQQSTMRSNAATLVFTATLLLCVDYTCATSLSPSANNNSASVVDFSRKK